MNNTTPLQKANRFARVTAGLFMLGTWAGVLYLIVSFAWTIFSPGMGMFALALSVCITVAWALQIAGGIEARKKAKTAGTWDF